MERSTHDLSPAVHATNGYRLTSPGVPGVGLRTHQLRYDNLSSGAFPRPAEEFLVASRFRRGDAETVLSIADYLTDAATTMLSRLDDGPEPEAPTPLPAATRLGMSLDEAVRRRRSIRVFTGDALPLAYLAALLRLAGGVTAEGEAELTDGRTVTVPFRSVPSGGGLYPVELRVAATNVDRLEPGIYRYLPRRDVLVRDGDRASLAALLGTFFAPAELVTVEAAAAVVLLVATPWRSMRKYGPRGLRFALHEAGGIAQTLHLGATALGVGTVDYASYYDDEADAALGLDGVLHTLVHTVIVGWPA